MTNYKLNILIEEQFQGCLEENWLQQVIEETLATCGVNSRVELGLLISNDGVICELNQKYRGVDEATDVLAFALTETESEKDSFITPPNGILHLGEVIISYPQAKRQAEEYGHPVEQELALLIIHGMLHLLGYEHDEPRHEKEMRALEEKILGQVIKKFEGKKGDISSFLS
jgi:probable rRNA maturation factor